MLGREAGIDCPHGHGFRALAVVRRVAGEREVYRLTCSTVEGTLQPSHRGIDLLVASGDALIRFDPAPVRLDSPGLISVTTDRLPARDSAEAALLYWLVDQGRRFRRCPALDARTDPAIPFVEVLDTSRPCYVFSPQSERVPMPAHLAGHVHCAGRTRRSPSKIGLRFLS